MNRFIPVVAVAVHHGVHHAFPHSHADPVLFVFVETRLFGRFQNLALGKIDALQRGWVVLVDDFFHACTRACIQGHVSKKAS